MRGAYGVVVLAGRESPGPSLLHSVRDALASGAAEVVVVVGSEAARARLRGLPVRTVVAQGGLGDSVAAGVARLGGRIESAVVTLANRTRVTSEHLRALARSLGERTVVASTYDGVVGAPAAFSRSEFPRLLALSGAEGAKSLLEGAATIDFAAGNVRAISPLATKTIAFGTPRLKPVAARYRPSRAPPVLALSFARP